MFLRKSILLEKPPRKFSAVDLWAGKELHDKIKKPLVSRRRKSFEYRSIQ